MEHKSSFTGAVFGDIIGAPFAKVNTYNRYFEIGVSQREVSGGRSRVYFPGVSEVSHSCAAVCRWLRLPSGEVNIENLVHELRSQYQSHPGADWTEATSTFLSSGNAGVSTTPDWAAAVRAIPIGAYLSDDKGRAIEAARACVMATCSNSEAIEAAEALTNTMYMASQGKSAGDIRTMLEHSYNLPINMPDDDLRAELRGEIRVPVSMLGQEVSGAYRYVVPEQKRQPSAGTVAAAALKAILQSDGWEDAVRRAVSFGGPSNGVAAIAGSVAQMLYGEVTPAIKGRLASYMPIDIAKEIRSQQSISSDTGLNTSRTSFDSIAEDMVDVLILGNGNRMYVIAEDRKEIEAAVCRIDGSAIIIRPDKADSIIRESQEREDAQSDSFEWGMRPELRQFYVKDGLQIVSPSRFVAPGMPSLHDRAMNLRAFLELRSYCIKVQKELNVKAGNEGAGQIHYKDAYHLWIGERRIDFMFGDMLAGRISLDSIGQLRVEMGEQRERSGDERFGDYAEQLWRTRSFFSQQDMLSPMHRIEDIRATISSQILDEGLGCGMVSDGEDRYGSKQSATEAVMVSNIAHLDKLDRNGISGSFAPIDEQFTGLYHQQSESQPIKTIHSIGYGQRSLPSFVNTLQMLGIDTVIDIRSFPYNRYIPHFNEDSVCHALEKVGISYLNGGESLGEKPSRSSGCYSDGTADWTAMSKADSFSEAVGKIQNLCKEGHNVAIVSSEGDPLSSHRFGLVSRSLAEKGMDVRHILHSGEVVPHSEMENRMLERFIGRNLISKVTSGTYREQVCEAYKVLNSQRGARMQNNGKRYSYKLKRH